MTSPSDRPIKLELSLRPNEAQLLAGLDALLQLGLISDAQVLRLGQERLTCLLPQRPEEKSVGTPATPPTAREPDFITAIATPTEARPPREQPTRPPRSPRSGLVTQTLQSLMAEISVVWLLFLGVFMVVVSSAVLAASQWRNFSPIGQYAILLAYTLAFWVASVVTNRQANLRLTSRMLQVVTLLIIPVNFWMIDGFKLWQRGPSGLGMMAVAALALSGITVLLIRPAAAPGQPWMMVANSLGLSWLHWGWGLAGFPLIAAYLGTIGTSLSLFYQSQNRAQVQPEASTRPLPLALIAIAFATLLLLLRAIFVQRLPVSDLGLALGVCGWLFCWLARRHWALPVWTQVGVGLLVVGWLFSVVVDPPWQAIAVSGLALWLVGDRLKRLWLAVDLMALWLIGLQAYYLFRQLIPPERRQAILSFCYQIAGVEWMPWAISGVAFFPYLGFTLLLANRLRRWQQPALALLAEQLALGFGALLTLSSLGNPLFRALNLLLSLLALGLSLRRRPQASPFLVYLTHLTGLAALCAWIHWFFPNLSLVAWAMVLLGLTAIEWVVSAGRTYPLWRESSWYLGLLLAASSYFCLLPAEKLAEGWGLAWLVVPALLTWLAHRSTFTHPQAAVPLSTIALLAAQPLTYQRLTIWMVSLAVATGLMVLNTRRLPQLALAVLTVGFGLSFAGVTAGRFWPDTLPEDWGLSLMAVAVWVLWLLRDWLSRSETPLARIYTAATNGWAIFLVVVNLLVLTFYSASTFAFPSQPTGRFLVAAALTTAAIVYRLVQQPTNLGFYGLAWGVEVLTLGTIGLNSRSTEHLAIANLGLGLATQLAGDVWSARGPEPRRVAFATFSSWHGIPLLFALIGLFLGNSAFTATTGLYTLAAAIVLIGVGRRTVPLQPLTYLGLLAVSVGAYEILGYRLSQAKGGQMGDGVVLLAGLAALLAVAYRVLARWLAPSVHLRLREVIVWAHLHWALGSGLALVAVIESFSLGAGPIWCGLVAVLAIYALLAGRQAETEPLGDFWAYAGILEAWTAIAYLLHRLLPQEFLLQWGVAIASIIALAMHLAPWSQWGWSLRPWQRSAMVLPGLVIGLTATEIGLPGLWIGAAFYAWLAWVRSQVRLSYLSLLLADWAFLKLFFDWQVQEPLWYTALASASLLYIAQVDPDLQAASARENRHWLRTIAVGLLCLTAFYQSDESLWQGFLTIGLGLGLVLLGLALRVRAFLYVGTLTVILKVLRQFWLFINDYSLLLWALGIVVGLLLIWIAATFEARRAQMTALLQYWITELEAWD